MTSKQSETMKTGETNTEAFDRQAASNSKVEHDIIIEAAHKVVEQWLGADKALASADAAAVYVMLQAADFGFFTDVSPANWHKIGTQQLRIAFADTVLTDLFGIKKPSAADRQRLQRIKLVVPALIKAGGLPVVTMSETGSIQINQETEYFKLCVKGTEGTGKQSVSIAKLDGGARQYLKGEIASVRAPQTDKEKKATKKAKVKEEKAQLAKLPSLKIEALSVAMIERVKAQDRATLSNSANKQLQILFVELIGLFAVDEATGLDIEKVAKIYAKVS